MLKIASTGDGLPVVLIHGWGLNSGVWQPCVDLLRNNYQVITVDIPGFGINADVVLTPYTLENIAKHIQAVVGKPAVYIGWSLGGLIATQIALSFPKAVKALVTVASSPCFVEQDNWPGIQQEVLTLFHRQLEQNTQKTIDNFLKIQAMGSPHIRHDIKLIRDLVMQYPLPSKQTLDQSLQFLEQVDQRASLADIEVPFLRLYGKLDGLVPKAVMPLVQHLASKSEQHVFTKASHAPFISDLDDFVAVLSQWIEQAMNGE